MKISDTFQKAKEVLLEQGWTKGSLQNSAGEVCLLGALQFVDSGDANNYYLLDNGAYCFLSKQIKDTKNGFFISSWNNAPGRTLSEVLDLLDEATIAAKEQGL